MRSTDRIVLAYSGGVGSSVAAARIEARHGVELVTLTVDVGQGIDLENVRARALALGARRAHVVDAREQFARDVFLRALWTDALELFPEGHVLPMAALSRPIVAKQLVAVAAIEGAACVAHGATATAARSAFEREIAALGSTVAVQAPAASPVATRAAMIDALHARGFRGEFDDAPGFANLFGRGTSWKAGDDSPGRGGEPWYTRTAPLARTPDAPALVEIEFVSGTPAAVNGVEMPLLELLSSVETIAGVHGVGRLQRRGRGASASREIVEAPAAVVLHDAHCALRAATAASDVSQAVRAIAAEYTALALEGPWCSPARESLDARVDAIEARVNGRVRLRFFKGACVVESARAAANPGDARRIPLVRSAPVGVGSLS